jgi:hypothetical protein
MEQSRMVTVVAACFALLSLPVFAGQPRKPAPAPVPSFSVSPGTLAFGDVNTGTSSSISAA